MVLGLGRGSSYKLTAVALFINNINTGLRCKDLVFIERERKQIELHFFVSLSFLLRPNATRKLNR